MKGNRSRETSHHHTMKCYDRQLPRFRHGPQASSSLLIDDHFRAALTLLTHAANCARDTHAMAWDFAQEIGKLSKQDLILSALLEQGWPDYIDDPLSGAKDIDRKTRSEKTLES